MADDRDEHPPLRRRRTGLRAALVAVLGLAAAGGAGYHAWRYRAQLGDARTALARAQLAQQHCSGRLADVVSARDGLRGEITDCKVARGAAEAKFSALESALHLAAGDPAQAGKGDAKALAAIAADRQALTRAREHLAGSLADVAESGRLAVVEDEPRWVLVRIPAGSLFSGRNAELSRKGELLLMQVAVALRQLPERELAVAGHADNRPLEDGAAHADHWALGAARAVAVTRFLTEAGFPGERLTAASYGSRAPIAPPSSESGRRKNRRVDVELVPASLASSD